jgi:metallophosphoesterase superfamily enzyme
MKCMAANKPTASQIRPDVWVDARRALWLAEHRVLVLADIHWGYAESHRATGNLIPRWGDGEIAARIEGLVADYGPAEMIWLGDSVHSLAGRGSAEEYIAQAKVPVLVLEGNHDVRWKRVSGPSAERGDFFLHHGHRKKVVPRGRVEIVGHHHPAVTWYDGAGGNLKIPALVEGPRRIILPAFSPWAAGTPWNSSLRAGETLWAVSARRVFKIPRKADPE